MAETHDERLLALNNDFTSGRSGVRTLPWEVFREKKPKLYAQWMLLYDFYSACWEWFDGLALMETTNDNRQVPLYPMRINPVRWVALKHAGLRFGQIGEDMGDSLAKFYFRDLGGKASDATKQAENLIDTVWGYSNGPEIQIENSLAGQVTGGEVFKCAWDPDGLNPLGVRIGTIPPDFFFPIWSSQNKWDLIECYVAYYISPEECEITYKVDPKDLDRVPYIEHWTKDSYEITVNGKVPQLVRTLPLSGNKMQYPLSGMNIWNVVPYVYNPHQSRGSRFFGLSHVPSVIGLVKEYNSRMADRGDKVKAQALDQYVLRNASTSGVKVRNISADFPPLLDIGQALPGSSKEPDLFLMERSGMTATGGAEYTDDIWELICHDTDTPGAAFGEQEGSQRSGATMEIRLAPLKDHITRERIYTTQAYNRINQIVSLMLVKGRMADEGILQMRPSVDWEEILPRERIDKVNEMVTRKSVDLVSTRQALLSLKKGEDVDQHLKEIEGEKAQAQQVAMEQMQAKASLGPDSKGGISQKRDRDEARQEEQSDRSQ